MRPLLHNKSKIHSKCLKGEESPTNQTEETIAEVTGETVTEDKEKNVIEMTEESEETVTDRAEIEIDREMIEGQIKEKRMSTMTDREGTMAGVEETKVADRETENNLANKNLKSTDKETTIEAGNSESI